MAQASYNKGCLLPSATRLLYRNKFTHESCETLTDAVLTFYSPSPQVFLRALPLSGRQVVMCHSRNTPEFLRNIQHRLHSVSDKRQILVYSFLFYYASRFPYPLFSKSLPFKSSPCCFEEPKFSEQEVSVTFLFQVFRHFQPFCRILSFFRPQVKTRKQRQIVWDEDFLYDLTNQTKLFINFGPSPRRHRRNSTE